MDTHRITATAIIPAPPREVYDVIADYHDGHPRILPKPPFVDLAVEEGGVGAGTVIRVGMRVFGRAQTFRAVVTEPEPGRVLVEKTDTGYVTTFTVEPVAGGRSSSVTISTGIEDRKGIPGALERWLVTRLLRPAYFRELDRLATVVRARAA